MLLAMVAIAESLTVLPRAGRAGPGQPALHQEASQVRLPRASATMAEATKGETSSLVEVGRKFIPNLPATKPIPLTSMQDGRGEGRSPHVAMQFGGRKSKSRFGDDGTREEGVDLMGAMEKPFGGGLFSGFKWGTEVEVGPKKKAKKSAARGTRRIPVGDNSDRGLGGNQAYRNTESARLGGEEGQRIRKAKLEAYITSEEAPADKTFGKIISGSLILTLILLLGAVVNYYGIDGLLAITQK